MGLCLSYLFISFHFSTQRCCPSLTHNSFVVDFRSWVWFSDGAEQTVSIEPRPHNVVVRVHRADGAFLSTFWARCGGGGMEEETRTHNERTQREEMLRKNAFVERNEIYCHLSSLLLRHLTQSSSLSSIVVRSSSLLSLICNQPAGNKSSNWILCVFVYEACKCSISWMGPQCSFFLSVQRSRRGQRTKVQKDEKEWPRVNKRTEQIFAPLLECGTAVWSREKEMDFCASRMETVSF